MAGTAYRARVRPQSNIPGEVLAGIPRPSGEVSLPRFPVHAILQREVMDLVQTSGARLVHVEEDRRARPEWVGYNYVQRM